MSKSDDRPTVTNTTGSKKEDEDIPLLLIQKEADNNAEGQVGGEEVVDKMEEKDSESSTTLQIEMRKTGVVDDGEDLLTVTKVTPNDDTIKIENEDEDIGKDKDKNDNETVNINDIIKDNSNNNNDSIFDVMKEQHIQSLETQPIITHPSDNLEMVESSNSSQPNIIDERENNVPKGIDQSEESTTNKKENSLGERKLSTNSNKFVDSNNEDITNIATKGDTEERVNDGTSAGNESNRFQKDMEEALISKENASDNMENNIDVSNELSKVSENNDDDQEEEKGVNNKDSSNLLEEQITPNIDEIKEETREEIDDKAKEETNEDLTHSDDGQGEVQPKDELKYSIQNKEQEAKDGGPEEKKNEEKVSGVNLQAKADRISNHENEENQDSTKTPFETNEIKQEEQSQEIQDDHHGIDEQIDGERIKENLTDKVKEDTTLDTESLDSNTKTDRLLTEDIDNVNYPSDEVIISPEEQMKTEKSNEEKLNPDDSDSVGEVDTPHPSNNDTEVEKSETFDEETSLEQSEMLSENTQQAHDTDIEKSEKVGDIENEIGENVRDENKVKMNIWDPVDYNKYTPPGSRKNSQEEELKAETKEDENSKSNENEPNTGITNEEIKDLDDINNEANA